MRRVVKTALTRTTRQKTKGQRLFECWRLSRRSYLRISFSLPFQLSFLYDLLLDLLGYLEKEEMKMKRTPAVASLGLSKERRTKRLAGKSEKLEREKKPSLECTPLTRSMKEQDNGRTGG